MKIVIQSKKNNNKMIKFEEIMMSLGSRQS